MPADGVPCAGGASAGSGWAGGSGAPAAAGFRAGAWATASAGAGAPCGGTAPTARGAGSGDAGHLTRLGGRSDRAPAAARRRAGGMRLRRGVVLGLVVRHGVVTPGVGHGSPWDNRVRGLPRGLRRRGGGLRRLTDSLRCLSGRCLL